MLPAVDNSGGVTLASANMGRESSDGNWSLALNEC